MSTWLWLTPLIIVVVHVALGRFNDERARREWSAFLRPDDPQYMENLDLAADFDAAAIGSTIKGAQLARARGERSEAERLLGLAYIVIEEARPDRLARLEAMARMIRMALAVAPAPPVAVAPLRMGRLRAIAAAGYVAHHALVTPAERFLLRLKLLAFAFGVAFGVITRARAAILGGDDRAWRTFEACAADWQCLDREHVESFRAFVVSLRMQTRTARA